MEYVEPFLIGGSIIAGAKLASKYMGPAFAPLIGGMPTGIIASFFLNNNKNKRMYFNGYMYSSFIISIIGLFIHYMIVNVTTISVDTIAVIGFVLWAVISYFIIKLNNINI